MHALRDVEFLDGASGRRVAHDVARPETVKHTSQGSPLLAGGVAFGLGLLAAVAFPATNAERHAAATSMEKAEPLKDEMKEVAHEWPTI